MRKKKKKKLGTLLGAVTMGWATVLPLQDINVSGYTTGDLCTPITLIP